MVRWLKLAWVLAAFAVLVVSLLLYDGEPNSDAEIMMGYAMLALSFPLGVALTAGLGLLARLLFETMGYVFTMSYTSMILAWLVFFVVGYLQWFVILPRLWNWWRLRRKESNLLL